MAPLFKTSLSAVARRRRTGAEGTFLPLRFQTGSQARKPSDRRFSVAGREGTALHRGDAARDTKGTT